jgi:hypothetical protein
MTLSKFDKYTLEGDPLIPMIRQIISEEMKVPITFCKDKSRIRTLTDARHLMTYVLNTLFYKSMSLAKIGYVTGERDHSSAIYSIKHIKNLKDTDKDIRRMLAAVIERVSILPKGQTIKIYKGPSILINSENKAIRCLFEKLTDDERLEIMSNYCKSCGCNDPRCQCGNDD